MRILDLFSGIGGFSLGLEKAGMKTVAFCEKDKFCQKVLKKHWSGIPIFDDITKLKGEMINETIDLVCGGFPCQPFSVAGKRKGKEDVRHLWSEMFRIIRETNPSFVIGENVSGIINLELEQVCTDLEGEGYEVQPFIIPACAINAPHRRDRIWIVAYSERIGRKRRDSIKEETSRENQEGIAIELEGSTEAFSTNSRYIGQEKPELETMGSEQLCGNDSNTASKRCNNRTDNRQERYILRDKNGNAEKGESTRERRKCGIGEINTDVADSTGKRLEGEDRYQSKHTECSRYSRNPEWHENWIEVAAKLCRVDARIPNRVDRLRALGNSIVPQIAEIIGNYIMLIDG